MTEPERLPEDYERRLAELAIGTIRGLQALEVAFRFLHPPRAAELRERLAPLGPGLAAACNAFRESVPAGVEGFHEQLAGGAGEVLAALGGLLEPGPPEAAAARVLGAMRLHSRAQETLYPLRPALPALNRFFAEAGVHETLASLDPPAPEGVSVGLHRGGGEAERERFALYVPEWLDANAPRPLVVALHGAMGSGREFLWSWLREARSRGFLLLAPSSLGTTWAFETLATDLGPLRAMVAYVSERWRVDPERVLLTGLSDGGTFALLGGLATDGPFTHLAPVSGVLHPTNFALGNLERARDRPVYLIHGALDWLFPVGLARAARDALTEAGAQLVYRELDDLSHAYPREENDRILRWFDPTLVPTGPA